MKFLWAFVEGHVENENLQVFVHEVNLQWLKD